MTEFIKQYWLEVLFSGMLGAVTYIVKRLYVKIKTESDEQKLLKEGMISLLHDRLFYCCNNAISKSEISVEELQNIETLYRSYHALGGNGTGTALYERCKSLKIVNQ